MAPRRGNQVVTLVAVVVALIAVWWTQRGSSERSTAPAPPPSVAPAPTPAAPIPTPPSPRAPRPPPGAATAAALDLTTIADLDERAAVAEIAAAIDRGGPFAYRKDGAVFENRERRLPARARGYWREYTVATPGEDDRGARRLVAGQRRELFYSRDHYRSFTAVRAAAP